MLYIYITIILQIRLLKRGKLYNMVVVNKIIHSQIFSFFSEESMENYAAIGIDVGGTNIKAGLVDAQGNLLSVQVVPTRKEQGSEQVLALIGEMIASLCASSARKVLGVSVALPGGVDDQAGKCLYCPNLGWKELPVREILTALTGLSVRLVNDANAACLGEYFYGKGRQARVFLSITLGTGIGSALVLQNQLYTGPFGAGVEAGHMVVEPAGALCNCGRRGCWETIVSASGIVRRAKEKMHKELSAKEVFQLAREGDPQAQAIVEETIFYLAIGLANLINLFSPEEIRIGGGVAQAEELFSKELYARVEENVYPTLKGKVKIEQSSLGYYSGIIGASTLWFHDINII